MLNGHRIRIQSRSGVDIDIGSRSGVDIDIGSHSVVNIEVGSRSGVNRSCAANHLTPVRPHGFEQYSIVLLSRPPRWNRRHNGHRIRI